MEGIQTSIKISKVLNYGHGRKCDYIANFDIVQYEQIVQDSL